MISEVVIAEGQEYSLAFVLDDVAKMLVGLHWINTGPNILTGVAVFNGKDLSRQLPAHSDVVFNLPTPIPYTEPVIRPGKTGIAVTGLETIGVHF